MLWRSGVIARKSLYTGILLPVVQNGDGPPPSRSVTEFVTVPLCSPTTAETLLEPYPPSHTGPPSPTPIMPVLRLRIATGTATVLFTGESLESFYGKRLLELPTPLNRTNTMRVFYESMQEIISNPPEMSLRALSVCFIAFSRRLFIVGRVANTATDPRTIMLRPGRPRVVRLPLSFRSSLGGLRVLSHGKARFSIPKVTLDVANDYEMIGPYIDFLSPWTGFLSIDTDQEGTMFVRASALQFDFNGRKKMSTLTELPSILHFTLPTRITPEELLWFTSLPDVEWLGMFLLKNELGQANNDRDIFDFQTKAEEKGIAFRLELKDKLLVAWCVELGPVDVTLNSGYNFVFCFIPHRSYTLAAPNFASDTWYRALPVAVTTLEHNVRAFLDRIGLTIGIRPGAVLSPPSGPNGRRVNQLLRIRYGVENYVSYTRSVHGGTSSRAPRNHRSAIENRTGLAWAGSSFIVDGGTPTRNMAQPRTLTRTIANPIGFRAPATPNTRTRNNSNFLTITSASGIEIAHFSDSPQTGNQPSRRATPIPNGQQADQNPPTVQPAGEQAVRPTNQASSSANPTRGNGQPARQATQNRNALPTSQNPTQAVNDQDDNNTVASPENRGAGQNGKRVRPSEGSATNEEMQPPTVRARTPSSIFTRYRDLQQRHMQVTTQYLAVERERENLLREAAEAFGVTGWNGATQSRRLNQMPVQYQNGLIVRRNRGVRQYGNERAARRNLGSLVVVSTPMGLELSQLRYQGLGRPSLRMRRAPERTFPARIQITYSSDGFPETNPEATRDTTPPTRNVTFHERQTVQRERNISQRTRTGDNIEHADISFLESPERSPERTDTLLRAIGQRHTQTGAQYQGENAPTGDNRLAESFHDGELSMREFIQPSLPGTQYQENSGYDIPGTRPLSATYGGLRRSQAMGAVMDQARAGARVIRESVELMPILEELTRTDGASDRWQVLHDAAPLGYPTVRWRAVELFPGGPFVGNLPLNVVEDLFQENEREGFDGRGFRFSYNGEMFLVFCWEDDE